jgi:hypothetical protein
VRVAVAGGAEGAVGFMPRGSSTTVPAPERSNLRCCGTQSTEKRLAGGSFSRRWAIVWNVVRRKASAKSGSNMFLLAGTASRWKATVACWAMVRAVSEVSTSAIFLHCGAVEAACVRGAAPAHRGAKL